jgi:hypothetical protein
MLSLEGGALLDNIIFHLYFTCGARDQALLYHRATFSALFFTSLKNTFYF